MKIEKVLPMGHASLSNGDTLTVTNCGGQTHVGVYRMPPKSQMYQMIWDGITMSDRPEPQPTWAERILQHPVFLVVAFTFLMAAPTLMGMLIKSGAPGWSMLGVAVGSIFVGMTCLSACMKIAHNHTTLKVRYWLKTGTKP